MFCFQTFPRGHLVKINSLLSIGVGTGLKQADQVSEGTPQKQPWACRGAGCPSRCQDPKHAHARPWRETLTPDTAARPDTRVYSERDRNLLPPLASFRVTCGSTSPVQSYETNTREENQESAFRAAEVGELQPRWPRPRPEGPASRERGRGPASLRKACPAHGGHRGHRARALSARAY